MKITDFVPGEKYRGKRTGDIYTYIGPHPVHGNPVMMRDPNHRQRNGHGNLMFMAKPEDYEPYHTETSGIVYLVSYRQRSSGRIRHEVYYNRRKAEEAMTLTGSIAIRAVRWKEGDKFS